MSTSISQEDKTKDQGKRKEENDDDEEELEWEDFEEEEEATDEEGDEEEHNEGDDEQQKRREHEKELLHQKFTQAETTAKTLAREQRNAVVGLFKKGRISFEPFDKENQPEPSPMPSAAADRVEEEEKTAAKIATHLDDSPSVIGIGPLSLGPFFFMILFLLMAPYTKVEESFNVQAMHDFIFGGGCKVPLYPVTGANYLGGTNTNTITNTSDINNNDSSSYCEPGLANFDHHNFPGVVPRTSLGALAIATVAAAPMRLASLLLPYVRPLIFLGVNEEDIMLPFLTDAMLALTICRFLLGSVVCASILFLGDSLDEFVCSSTRKLNKGILDVSGTNSKGSDDVDEVAASPLLPSSALSILVALTQFHTLYYASRPLPNTFATIGVNLAFGFILRKMPKLAIFCLAFTTCIFRSDISVLALPLCVIIWLLGDISFTSGIATGISSMVASALVVLPLDSAFWTFAAKTENFKWLWPEFAVLYFNTAKNRSSEWGVSPFHWYVTSALPRGVAAGLIFLVLAFVSIFTWNRASDKKSKMEQSLRNQQVAHNHIYSSIASQLFLRTTLPCVLFVAMYSILPHKELRFILPCFAVLIIPAAYWLSQLVCLPAVVRNGGPSSKITNLVITFSILASLGMIVVMVNTNKEMYPGGKALEYVNAQVIEQRAWYLTVQERKRMKQQMKARGENNNNGDDNNNNLKSEHLMKQQQQQQQQQSFTIFIDAFAGMTGATRFGKLRSVDFGQTVQEVEDVNELLTFPTPSPHLHPVSVNYVKDEKLFNLSDDGIRDLSYGNGVKFDFLIVRAEDTDWHVSKMKCGGCRPNLLTGEDNGECCCGVMKTFPIFSRLNVVGFVLKGEKFVEWKPYINVIGFSGSKCYLP